MMLPYTVCLNFKEPIEGNHIESEIKSFLESLKNPITPQYSVTGGVVAKTAQGDSLYFDRGHAAFIPIESIEAIEAVRFALSTAKDMQDGLPGRLKFEFDPNAVYLEISNTEKNTVTAEDLKLIGQELQKTLYGGGNFAYTNASFMNTIILGTEEKIAKAPAGKKIVETEGTAQYVAFLDDLLTIIK